MRQTAQVEEFLHTFADIEVALKKRSVKSANTRSHISVLIEDYVTRNPYWCETADRLRTYKDIRNILTHRRGTKTGYPLAVTPASLQDLREIAKTLAHPRPISDNYRKRVNSVSDDDTLAKVLSTAFSCGFSQFPVVNAGKFGGLITESEIVRWLGRWTRQQRTEVNFGTTLVRNVLKEKDPYMRGIAVFRFAALDDPEVEVMARFATEQALEVILLTSCGTNRSPIEGIVTQWDAARYAN